MKLQFKHQQFQADVARAVVEVFAGQPYSVKNYLVDNGKPLQTEILNELCNCVRLKKRKLNVRGNISKLLPEKMFVMASSGIMTICSTK